MVTSGGDILPSTGSGMNNGIPGGRIVEALDSSGLSAGRFDGCSRAPDKRLVSAHFLAEVLLQLDSCDQKTRILRERELISNLPLTRCLRYRCRYNRRRAQC